MFTQVSRETRKVYFYWVQTVYQKNMADHHNKQILTYIEESLENLKDEIQDVVMIDLSAYDLDNDSVLEMIHVKYNAEIIGKRMFIKVSFILAFTPIVYII